MQQHQIMVSSNLFLILAICLDTSPTYGCKGNNQADGNSRKPTDAINTSTTTIGMTISADHNDLTSKGDSHSGFRTTTSDSDNSNTTTSDMNGDKEKCCTSIELSWNKSSFKDKNGIEGVYIKASDLKESVYFAPKNHLGSRIIMFHPNNGWMLIVSNPNVTGTFDLYKSLIRFECEEACLEKCKNNSLLRYYNESNESNEWYTGSDIKFRCKTDDQKAWHKVDLSDIYGFIVDNEIMVIMIGSTIVAVFAGITICCVLRRRNKQKSAKLQGEIYINEHLDYDEVEPEDSDKDSIQSDHDYDEAEAVNETDFTAQATTEITVRENEKMQKNGNNRMTQNFHTSQEELHTVEHNAHRKDLKIQNSETNLARNIQKENEIVISSENPYYDASERINTEGNNRGSFQSTGTFVRCDSDDSLHLTIPNTDTFQMVCATENPYYGDVIVTPPDDLKEITTERENCQRDPVMSSIIHRGHENVSRNDKDYESINAPEDSQVSKQSQHSSKYSLSEGVILNLTAGEVQCINDYSDN